MKICVNKKVINGLTIQWLKKISQVQSLDLTHQTSTEKNSNEDLHCSALATFWKVECQLQTLPKPLNI